MAIERISLTDGTDGGKKWFDAGKAVVFKELGIWDGKNRISKATGSQWEHERLYFTRNGRWVLNEWSQQYVSDVYTTLTEQQAIRWLISQNCFVDEGMEKLPHNVQARVREAFESAEI